MPIAANIRISNYDAEKNFNNKLLNTREHMFFNNNVYDIQKLMQQEVYSGNNSKVIRQGNIFVLRNIN